MGMSEDIMKLFVLAQKEGLEMRKFNLWIELQLRHKYDLGELHGFEKFTKRYNLKEQIKDGVDNIKKKVKHFQKLAKYGHNYEVPEMIRKYAKHKGKDEVKATDYLNKIGSWSDNLLQEFEMKNEEYFDGFYGDSECAETQFFKDLFMRTCKFATRAIMRRLAVIYLIIFVNIWWKRKSLILRMRMLIRMRLLMIYLVSLWRY